MLATVHLPFSLWSQFQIEILGQPVETVPAKALFLSAELHKALTQHARFLLQPLE
jgi:hypothetical protein